MALLDEAMQRLSFDPRRWAVTAGALAIHALGAHIPLPGLDPAIFESLSSTRTPDRLTIFGLGVLPILMATALVEMARLLVPPLARWAAARPTNREWPAFAARAVALALAAVQATAVAAAIRAVPLVVVSPAREFTFVVVITFVGATAFLVWLADAITRWGVGDGLLLLVAAPIVARLPIDAVSIYRQVQMGVTPAWAPLGCVVLIVAAIAMLVAATRAAASPFRLDVWPPLLGSMALQAPMALAPGLGGRNHTLGLVDGGDPVGAGLLAIALVAAQAALIVFFALRRRAVRSEPDEILPGGRFVIGAELVICGFGLALGLFWRLPGAAMNGCWLIICVAAALSLMGDQARPDGHFAASRPE